MVSCQKGPTRNAYAWQIGPFWQETLDIYSRSISLYTVGHNCNTKVHCKITLSFDLSSVVGTFSIDWFTLGASVYFLEVTIYVNLKIRNYEVNVLGTNNNEKYWKKDLAHAAMEQLLYRTNKVA